MFPYPSGKLHMGHLRNYTLSDVIARWQKMCGKNVMQVIGWDAFGLPAENAAKKHGIHPNEWTTQNIASMREQFNSFGCAFDWSRELNTADPAYYRWEQWLFIQMFKRGLAYKKMANVNWDPVDKTVLANEQVIDGKGWRSGAVVEKKQISQWFIKITEYADELLQDLDKLHDWPQRVKQMQKNWIGKSSGINITFQTDNNKDISVFTTRADTLFGATYIAIAPGHNIAKQAAKSSQAINDFIESCSQTSTMEKDAATIEKRGINTNVFAIHPVTKQKLPIWIANFVLTEYGSGAVMCVPAHDQRDFEFASKYALEIKQVIKPNEDTNFDITKAAYTESSGSLINSQEFSGLDCITAQQQITKHLEQQNCGKTETHFRLRDWGVSRQRYWGAPIPMIICDDCGVVPVNEEDLPVALPLDIDFSKDNISLKDVPDFYNTTCPKCKKPAVRETDTFDTFMESSWYFARFACPDTTKAMLDERVNYWMPVDQYVGGIEHAILHLLYARFYYKVLRDLGLVKHDEPFKKLLTQGMVLKDGAKMSKSKGNVVDPAPLIEEYGADTARLFMMFAAPPAQNLEWNDQGIHGANRFLKKLWKFVSTNVENIKNVTQKKSVSTSDTNQQKQRFQLHTLLKQASYDISINQFNTVVSAAMKMLNMLEEVTNAVLQEEIVSVLLRVLYPITPHISFVLWQEIYGSDIASAAWPKVDESALTQNTITIVIQVNGKLRDQIDIEANTQSDDVIKAAMQQEKIQKLIAGKTIKKTIYVPKKLVNLVAI